MKRKARELGDQDDVSSSNSEDETSVTSGGSDEDSSGSDTSGSESDPEQDINVDFEFFDPQEIDFHGLKALLQTYLDGTAYDCSQLVETMIQQVRRSVHVSALWVMYTGIYQGFSYHICMTENSGDCGENRGQC